MFFLGGRKLVGLWSILDMLDVAFCSDNMGSATADPSLYVRGNTWSTFVSTPTASQMYINWMMMTVALFPLFKYIVCCVRDLKTKADLCARFFFVFVFFLFFVLYLWNKIFWEFGSFSVVNYVSHWCNSRLLAMWVIFSVGRFLVILDFSSTADLPSRHWQWLSVLGCIIYDA